MQERRTVATRCSDMPGHAWPVGTTTWRHENALSGLRGKLTGSGKSNPTRAGYDSRRRDSPRKCLQSPASRPENSAYTGQMSVFSESVPCCL